MQKEVEGEERQNGGGKKMGQMWKVNERTLQKEGTKRGKV